ncbi:MULTISPECIES: DNA topoisomerase III [Pseudomonadota]|uniref:DNA topoisomerase n=19 Tax=Pseudomonadota TaxID=1224 RepID=A0A1Z3MKT2_ALCFA|nr:MULTISPECIES: DNA topoisomerase III [Pseudomonadota]EOQ81210.1 DNA topoisomerase III [Pseudomonas aeruginosa VRFPA02]MCU2657120.1 DNA topoisomerase III [Enterobacter hormaechei subsp. hoffmannii]HAB2220643.1 DNA topoisomerase III [Salmonella enterica subsp. enterica serovar Ohio]HBC2001245.1 DNA topoisomerase III [Citrobacter freundii]HBY0545778.1 DNA topoisomerase III [Klebsiella pneumoniae subsp. pneumoniae]HCD7306537.1 DNA topoisomerase III [Enterobacter hormaechei]HEB2583436.1 DNA top
MRLFLCEKPSQGKDIGRILGATQRGEGCLNGSGVTITWCIGHLVEAAAPEVYDAALKRWSLEQLPIIPQQWRVEVKPKTATQFKVVKALLAKATHLVIATDADREGELIAREIIDLCGYRGPIERLWLSALNDASIRTALGKLRPSSDTLPMYYSALARSRADWLVGMNLSRLFTLLGRQAGYDGVLSVGRVQTPTLKLVVDRDREIAAFKSAPFWAIDVSLSTEGQAFSAQWVAPDGCTDDAGRCLQQPVAQQAAQQIRAAGSAQVVSVETERVREGPPLLFDLGTLQEVCSRQLGLDVQETLQIAQALYETHKATTYPRSDSGYLPESMFAEVPTVLDSLLKTDPSLRPIMGQLDRTQRSRAWNDGKVTAHHGIIPTLEPANLSVMSEKERAVYRLIRAHYLAQFLPHHEFDRTVAELSCGQQKLVATGKQVVVKGWRLVLDEPEREGSADEDADASARSQVLPALREAMACQIAGADIKALKTMPPKPYTQGELVKAMKGVARFVTDPRLKQKLKDTTGIGTEATRANIISGLITRGYIVKKGRSIRASDAAFTLIDAVPAAIADPGTTAVWEQALDMIEAGQLTLDVFIGKQAAWISQLIAQYGSMSLSIKLAHGPACPQCGASTRQRTGKSGPFWSCSRYPDCKGTLPVESGPPKRGASRSRSSGRKGA